MKRQTLETAISEILAPVLAHDPAATFDVLGCGLWRDGDGGWAFNDAFRIARDADLTDVKEAARGRWVVFKANYAPRARVADIDSLGWIPGDGCIYIECDYMSFLEIRVNYSAATA